MVKTVCRYFFSYSRILDANIGDYSRKGSIFGTRQREYANTWGGGGGEGGHKSLQIHFCCIPFVFITICIHSAFTFMRF